MIRHCDRCACETAAYGCWVCGAATETGTADSRAHHTDRWEQTAGCLTDDLLDDEETP